MFLKNGSHPGIEPVASRALDSKSFLGLRPISNLLYETGPNDVRRLLKYIFNIANNVLACWTT